MMRLGLTGGIGSGKSTVAQMLVNRGAALVDADAVARSVTAPGGLAIDPIRAEFGQDYISPDGAMDRERMRALAFSVPGAKQRLESIVHPLVGQETQRQAQAAFSAGKHCVVFDIPLLVESGHWPQKLNRILVVDCGPQTQIARVMQRSGLTQDAVEKIIAAQAPRPRRLRAADAVIHNDGLTLAQLEAQVEQVAIHFGL
jgi:dephospho-CoA kinase